MTANEIKFRCSSLGYIMTEPQKKSELLSETCKTHLIDVFVSAKYGRREELTSKFLDKGNECEEDSVTLLSRVTKHLYKKNSERLTNNWISGEPDLYKGESIRNAEETTDTKTSWSAHTFFRVQKDALNKMYYWQGQGYMALTGAKRHTVSYCLVNGTPQAITDEKKRLAYKMNLIDPTMSPEYLAKAQQIERNHIFDMALFLKHNEWFELDSVLAEWDFDIPKEDRVFSLSFERDDLEIARIYQRVEDCRLWIAANLWK